jgi:glycosyltransferase involved in cell wall biosynthesis
MNIVQITPGAGGMYCGGCFRDNALVGALRKLGHQVLMVPLYLPVTLDEPDNSEGSPTFFGGINVYLEQKSSWFRNAPSWVRRFFDSQALLKLAAKVGAKTRPQDLGDLTLSMLRGEEGYQARELQELIVWLKQQEKPDVICLSNALLAGMAHQFQRQLHVPTACLLSGEDAFLDALPATHRQAAWEVLSKRAQDIDIFIAPSHYFAELMQTRLRISGNRVRVVPNGLNLDGYGPSSVWPNPPVLGYFARMCREKGFELLAETYLAIRQRGRVPRLKIRFGGGLGPSDQPLVDQIRRRFAAAGCSGDVEFHPNLNRAQKQDFLRSLTVFSTPALYGEAFGLYVIEAFASGVPVVQPRHAAFPELIEASGGGVIAELNVESLAQSIEQLLLNPAQARALGAAGRTAALERFSSGHMAQGIASILKEVVEPKNSAVRAPHSAF